MTETTLTAVRKVRDQVSLTLDPLGRTQFRRRQPLPLREAARKRIQFERDCFPTLADDLRDLRTDVGHLVRYARWQAAARVCDLALAAEAATRRSWEAKLDPNRNVPSDSGVLGVAVGGVR